jgi:hypothetical protein
VGLEVTSGAAVAIELTVTDFLTKKTESPARTGGGGSVEIKNDRVSAAFGLGEKKHRNGTGKRMQMQNVGLVFVQDCSKCIRSPRIAFAIERRKAEIPGYFKAPNRSAVVIVAAGAGARVGRSRHGGFESHGVLAGGKAIHVHLRAAGGIGIERIRNVKDAHVLD